MPCSLYFSCTDTALTLWWDKPEDAPQNAVYQAVLNGCRQAETNRTHLTFSDLPPETRCHAAVWMGDQLLGEMDAVTLPAPNRLSVADFGAVGDGKTLNTAALQKALDACSPGDEVYFPRGMYLTGALRLRGDMRIYLEEGAVLQGTENPEDYLPKIPSRFEGIEQECYQSLLNLGSMDHASGPNCRNVLIHGKGTICGGGQPLALRIIEREQKLLEAYLASLGESIREYESEHTIAGRARGRLINLSNCENVRITGLTLQNGASWNVHMLYSRNIVTDHCTFISENVWNGDGWDPDSSEHCTLFACRFRTGDDSVAIKSGKNPEGNKINRPARHIAVFDCKSECGLGIAIGSEISGGVEDVRIWDCDLEHSLYGVQIKGTKKRGGYVKNVSVRDCVLSRFLVCAVKYNDDGEGAPMPPVFSGFTCSGTHLTGWARNYWEKENHHLPAIDLSGFDVPGYEAKEISFIDCSMGEQASVNLICCENVNIHIKSAK